MAINKSYMQISSLSQDSTKFHINPANLTARDLNIFVDSIEQEARIKLAKPQRPPKSKTRLLITHRIQIKLNANRLESNEEAAEYASLTSSNNSSYHEIEDQKVPDYEYTECYASRQNSSNNSLSNTSYHEIASIQKQHFQDSDASPTSDADDSGNFAPEYAYPTSNVPDHEYAECYSSRKDISSNSPRNYAIYENVPIQKQLNTSIDRTATSTLDSDGSGIKLNCSRSCTEFITKPKSKHNSTRSGILGLVLKRDSAMLSPSDQVLSKESMPKKQQELKQQQFLNSGVDSASSPDDHVSSSPQETMVEHLVRLHEEVSQQFASISTIAKPKKKKSWLLQCAQFN